MTDGAQRLGGDSISAMRLVASAHGEKLQISFIDIFKHPKLADLAAIGSRAGQDEKAEKLIQPFALIQSPLTATDVLGEIVQQCHIPIEKIQDAYPTSPLQEILITLSIKQPGAYVAQHILALDETVDIKKLKNAWQHTVQETDVLRTRIIQLRSGTIIQAVLTEDPIDWRETASLNVAKEDAGKISLHLGAKLASYTLVCTSSSERYLVWTIHHALYDGWSISLMLQRVQQLYAKGVSSLPQTPYVKFIQYVTNAHAEASTEYWRRSLTGAAPYQFPQQSHIVSDDNHHGQTLQHVVKKAPHRHTDVTPSNVIRAAWALVIAAYTSSDDVIFGETLACRDIAMTGITSVCGPTLTTVPTRIKLDYGATVEDFLKVISRNATDRIPYQHYGLFNIKAIGEEMAAACNFQNLLIIQTENEAVLDSMWSVHDNDEQSNFFTHPLVIECKMGQSNIEILAHYNTNVISSWQVQHLLYQLESVLAQLNAASHVHNVHVFSEQDMQLIRTWNAYEPEVFDDTVPSRFFQQVANHPHKVAVSAFDGEFTYTELGDLASMLAQELVKHGAGPEMLIPICLNKSRWAIVAIIGILISGAAYVPLSPEYPASRNRQIIETSKSTIVVCSPAYESRFATLLNCIIPVSEATIRQLPACRSPILARAKSDDTCYVIFTSGSTGVPKGVVMEHRSIVTSSMAICNGLHITPESRVFQFCSFLFDVSVGETLTALMCGATVCVPSDEQRTTDLAAAITSLGATWAFLTPSVASTLDGPHAVPTLKTLVAGGEAMTGEIIEKWASGLKLYNGYGPTEGAVFAVTNDQVSTQRDPSNIGQMLKSGRVWLTRSDNPHQLAPVGAVAELCLEGPLLARGYLNDPERTAESFVKNPTFLKQFVNTADIRIYRTGDLVQYTPDGSLKYMGRKDDQIKLAGQRIETGEIEHHLQSDQNVRQVIVKLPQSGPCAKKLTAVLSFNNDSITAINARQPWHTLCVGQDVLAHIYKARERLADLVPSYMVPTIWIPVLSIPSLASTKFDKPQVSSWLETLDDSTYQRILELEKSEYATKPVNAAFKTLQSIWAKALSTPVSDIQANKSWLCKFDPLTLVTRKDHNANAFQHLVEIRFRP